MVTCSRLSLVFLLLLFISCKKKELVDPSIAVEQVYVTAVTADRIDMNYKLSHLGYQETGISYYKQTSPQDIRKVKAIRKEGNLLLSIQSLEENTEYVFKVFYVQNNVEKFDGKEHKVKTLSLAAANYLLTINDSKIVHNERNEFEVEIEGVNLQNLNLIDLEVRVNNVPLQSSYPVLIDNKKYKLKLSGTLPIPQNGNYFFSAKYQEAQILHQNVIFYVSETYFLSQKAVNLRNNFASVFNNRLFYFVGNDVLRWNEAEERLQVIGSTLVGRSYIGSSIPGHQFEDQLFFSSDVISYEPLTVNVPEFTLVETYGYNPSSNQWQIFSIKESNLNNKKKIIESQNFFIHNDQLYFTYALRDDPLSNPQGDLKYDSYFYRYDALTKQFQKLGGINTEIQNYHLVSVKNNLYLLGLIPVSDQGFKIGFTFCVYKVNDQTFQLEEVYRKGDFRSPYAIRPKSVIEYEGSALIINAVNEFLLFDTEEKKLVPVNIKNPTSHMYFGGTFVYNSQLHLNADVGFTSGKIYEISINKER